MKEAKKPTIAQELHSVYAESENRICQLVANAKTQKIEVFLSLKSW